MIVVISTVRRVDFLVCVNEADNVLVVRGITSLAACGALVGVAFAAPCGCNFMDKMLYLGHLPDGVEEGNEDQLC